MVHKPTHVLVLAHPAETSFNAEVARVYAETARDHGHDVIIRDLYRMNFDPVLKDRERPGRADFQLSPEVQTEIALIEAGDAFVFVYPIWFGLPPAILVGYIDRVIAAGVTVSDVQARAAQGVLTGKRMLHIVTSGASGIWLDEQGQVQGLKSACEWYLERMFRVQTADHLELDHIRSGMPDHHFRYRMHDVRDAAKRICVRLSKESETPLRLQTLR